MKIKARPKHTLRQIPRHEWTVAPPTLLELWKSAAFCVSVYSNMGDTERISVSRYLRPGERDISGHGVSDAVFSWEELQDIKRQVGRGNRFAVEIYPPDGEVVNVANVRHLLVLPPSLVGILQGDKN